MRPRGKLGGMRLLHHPGMAGGLSQGSGDYNNIYRTYSTVLVERGPGLRHILVGCVVVKERARPTGGFFILWRLQLSGLGRDAGSEVGPLPWISQPTNYYAAWSVNTECGKHQLRTSMLRSGEWRHICCH